MGGLYDGRYEPGERLVEANLTAAFGTSRGPVREALNRLAALGVVELTRQRGAQIIVLTPDHAIDILVVAKALLGTAARHAALNIAAPGAREQMEAALAAVIRFAPSSGSVQFATARNGYYAALTRIAGNAELRRILPSVRIHIVRVQFRSILRTTDQSRHSDYHRIADAVLAGKPAAAEAALRLHIDRAIRALVAHRDAAGNLGKG